MKPSKVVATPISGVYKAPLTVELECPSVRVESTAVLTTGLNGTNYASGIISKVGNVLFFNAQSNFEFNGKLGIYDINNNIITQVPCPYPTFEANFVYANNAVYIIGGKAVFGERHNRIMKRYNGDVYSISETLPESISNVSCNAIGNYIYIIGGKDSDGNELSTIYRLNTETDTIELMTYRLKTGCESRSSAVYQNRYIYIAQLGERKTQIIDTEKGIVSFLSKDLPESVYYPWAMIKDDFLYINYNYDVYKKYLLDDSDWILDTQTLKYARSRAGYTLDEKGYYHIIGGASGSYSKYYETGRFGLPSSDIEIRYTQTADGTTPPDPTQADTKYTSTIELTSPTKHKIKAKAFYVGT